MKKTPDAFSFRIGIDAWLLEEDFTRLLDLFDRHPGLTNQISLFTSETHPPLPLPVIRERAAIARERIAYGKRRGYSVGINVLSTMGHHSEDLEHSLQGDMTYLTGVDGTVCLGSFCPNDPGLLEYARELYTAVAKAAPDFIWVDDDVRFNHMPAGFGCFCDRCLGLFAEETGVQYTRESIAAAFSSTEKSAMMKVRLQWVQHNRDTIARLLRKIADASRAVSPDIVLGFMSGELYYEGMCFPEIADALSDHGKHPVMWRPGGGAYTDSPLKSLVDKSGNIGRQIACIPDSDTCVQSEIENFPYQLIKKGPRATALEAASHIAAGCTGTAFNVLPFGSEPQSVYEPLLEEILKTLPFYRTMAETLGRIRHSGIHTGWNRDSVAAANYEQGSFVNVYPLDYVAPFADEIFELGLPVAYDADSACAHVLNRSTVRTMSRERILRVLSQGAYLEPEAAEVLTELGFADLVGFRVERYIDKDCLEQFVDHPMNPKESVDVRRNCRQAFFPGSAAALVPLDARCETMSRLVDYHGEILGTCGMGLFENRLGGRICVAGYYPWSYIQDSLKSAQLKALFRWLSKDALPSVVDSFRRMQNHTRILPDGNVAIALMNESLDRGDDTVVRIRTDRTICRCTDMDNRETRLEATGRDGAYATFRIPTFDPWSMLFLVTMER